MDTWKIWFECFWKQDDTKFAAGVLPYEYKRKGDAVRRAKKHFSKKFDNRYFKYVISKTNPWSNREP